jgi:protein required for attachment to host cells
MAKHLVVVADAARASVYCLDTQLDPRATRPPQLVELESLVNPSSRQKQSELYAQSRPGLRRRPGAGPIGAEPTSHGLGDRRDAHDEVDEQRFAEAVMEALARAADELEPEAIVLAAAPKMLGRLRATSTNPARDGAPLLEVPKDLTKMSPSELHSRLAEDDLLPAPIRLSR